MDTARWQRVKEIFEEAVACEPAERCAYIEEACRGDADLRSEVESLLQSDSQSEDFLETPATTGLPPGWTEESFVGTRIGHCLLTRVISHGGMGTVYEATQEAPKRTVAVKVMKRGVASRSALRRFEYEAEILAKLKHPGIAQVLEAGTHGEGDSGVPYFVLEYIEDALSITDYARKKELSIKESLELFAQVCDAVHYGHQKGVIHRDLKPANLLVDPSGRLKVIDFGVARATDSDMALTTVHTEAGRLIGTLQFMSPEQCKADSHDLDTRSDVYSLGIVLYEFLCGKLPYDIRRTSVLEAVRRIQETPPKRPSTINRALRGDVETIVLKALEKERSDRYQTVAELGADIRRYLSGEVILAKSSGLATRIWKQVKRNPIISASMGVALLALLITAVTVPWIIVEAERDKRIATEEARREAEKQREIADQKKEEVLRLSDVKILNDLLDEMDGLWPSYPEMILPMERWVKRAKDLLTRTPLHRERLDTLRAKALLYDEEARRKDWESHPDMVVLRHWRAQREEALEKAEKYKAGMEITDRGYDRESEESLKRRIAIVGEKITRLEEEVSKRRTWAFEDIKDQWEHDILWELVSGLERLGDEETGALRNINRRLEFARTIYDESIGKHLEAWNRAIASISDPSECPLYDGLLIEPQIGFIPLGRNPDTGLWEFAHLQTGEVPERRDDGTIFLGEASCLVFVLIPGGIFDMGAVKPSEEYPAGSPNVDPWADFKEQPVHEVEIRPFLLSKYEMTQAQWTRFTDDNPSLYPPGAGFGGKTRTGLHPVEQVSWEDCARVMKCLALRLPTEAEWEYAARAGTFTVWWTGNEKNSLEGAANLKDRFYARYGGDSNADHEEWLNDGYTVHAPVDRFEPNPFGLLSMLGNVEEWCRDYFRNNYDRVPLDGSAFEYGGSRNRVSRGGGWVSGAEACRCAGRNWYAPNDRRAFLGLRPAADLKWD